MNFHQSHQILRIETFSIRIIFSRRVFTIFRRQNDYFVNKTDRIGTKLRRYRKISLWQTICANGYFYKNCNPLMIHYIHIYLFFVNINYLFIKPLQPFWCKYIHVHYLCCDAISIYLNSYLCFIVRK